MGRKRTQHWKEQHGKERKKLWKAKNSFWVEKCQESARSAVRENSNIFKVLITKVELSDGHGSEKSGTTTGSEVETSETNDLAGPSMANEQTVSAAASADGTAVGIGTDLSSVAQSGERSAFVKGDFSILIRRDSSAKKPKRRFNKGSTSSYTPLPHGDCGDGIRNPHPESVDDKYWAQRERLFSKYDEGIQLDCESWFSVTPEAIADHIASRMVQGRASHEMVILEAFAGVGGNAIAFAKRPEVKQVVCVEVNSQRLELAASNCRVYDIPASKVVFVCANAKDVLASYVNGVRVQSTTMSQTSTDSTYKYGYALGGCDLLPERIDALFLSPPWGGPDYEAKSLAHGYDLTLAQLEGWSSSSLLQLSAKALPRVPRNVCIFLPRNTNGKTTAAQAIDAGFEDGMEMEQNVLNDKLKTITVYLGLSDPHKM